MDFAELERAGWSDAAIAKAYANGFSYAAELCVEALVEAAGARQGGTFLDICCGHGIVTEGAVEVGAEATGLDFSPAFLDMARRAVPEARFLEGDAMALPFKDAGFDAVAMGFGILHVPDAAAAVAEAARVLRPGGRFAYSCWHGAERTSVLPAVFGAIQRHGDPSVVLPPSHPAPYYAQPEHALPLMEGAGLTDIRLETVESHWVCKSADEPLICFEEGTVRGSKLLKQQPREAYAAIRAEVMAWVEANGSIDPDGEGKLVPLPAAIVSGRKPLS